MELIRDYQDDDTPEIRERVAMTLLNKGMHWENWGAQ